jgi:hypothetical protein
MAKKSSKPAAWKNTFFWLAALGFVIFVIGLIRGDAAIRDPGQKRENGIALFYLLAAIVMLVNGLISHRLTVMQHQENESNDHGDL